MWYVHNTYDTLRERFATAREAIQVQVDICAVAFHRDKLKVAAKVAGVQTRERKAVAEASHRSKEVGRLEVRVQVVRPSRGIRIRPH